MLTNISWFQFGITMLLLSAVYYSIVIWSYYKKELVILLRQGLRPWDNPAVLGTALKASKEISPGDLQQYDAVTAGNVADLMEDVKNAVSYAQGSGATAKDLFQLLNGVLIKYPQIKVSAQKAAINELLIEGCKSLDIDLSIAQAHALWM